jgi:hypothetical protein
MSGYENESYAVETGNKMHKMLEESLRATGELQHQPPRKGGVLSQLLMVIFDLGEGLLRQTSPAPDFPLISATPAAMTTWSPDLVKLPEEAPSVPAHSRTGTTKAGPQTASQVQCKESEWHGFRPSNEACPYCAPVKAAPVAPYVSVGRAESWWAHVHTGVVYDLNTPGWQGYKSHRDYIPLVSVLAHTVEAKRVCGCSAGGKCQVYKNKVSGNRCEVHFSPYICRDDEWEKV